MIHRPLILIAALLTLAVAPSVAQALAWQVVPDAAHDPADRIAYWLTEDTADGAELGPATLFVGPLAPDVARDVLADEFARSGRTICLHARAISAENVALVGQEVHRCDRFPVLPAPALLAPR